MADADVRRLSAELAEAKLVLADAERMLHAAVYKNAAKAAVKAALAHEQDLHMAAREEMRRSH